MEQTDRNVFILGAGFSQCAGAPLIYNFLDKARDLMDDPLTQMEDYEKKYFKDAFSFRRDMALIRDKMNIDLDNIEELFGLVEISNRLGIGKRNKEIRDAIVYVIVKTLNLSIKMNRGHIQFQTPDKNVAYINEYFPVTSGTTPTFHTTDIYEYFAAITTGFFDDPVYTNSRSNTFITFNYDLILDHALGKLGINPDYKIPNDKIKRYEIQGNRKKCSLLKLHGSANWGICEDCQGEIIILQDKVTDEPTQFKLEKCSTCKNANFVPLLIPPSWDKSEYQNIFAPIWKEAIDELKNATRIFIIGYSMPPSDLFFKYLMTVGLSENHNLYKLIVIDYNAPNQTSIAMENKSHSKLEARYRKLLDPVFRKRRFKFINAGFPNILSNNYIYNLMSRAEYIDHNVSIVG